METDYRGKGVSADKVCKGTGIPKHAGNFSYSSIHARSLQSKDYHVTLKNHTLIVGENTPLSDFFKPQIIELLFIDPLFSSYTQNGLIEHNGKTYESVRTITKYHARYTYLSDIKFILRIQVYTDLEFKYEFPCY